jgi:hypothetical protein
MLGFDGILRNHGVSVGRPLSQGDAVAADVLTGKTFSNKTNSGVAGAMPENGALNPTPGAAAVPIPAGHTTGGQVAAVVVPVANVLAGTTIAGQAGTMTNRGAYTASLTSQNQSIAIPAGYHNGSGYMQATYAGGIIIPSTPAARTAVNQSLSSISVVGVRTQTAYTYNSSCRLITFDYPYSQSQDGLSAYASYNYTGPAGIQNGTVQARIYLYCHANGASFDILNNSVTATGITSAEYCSTTTIIIDANGNLMFPLTSGVKFYSGANLSSGFDIVMYTYSANSNYTPSPRCDVICNINVYT